MGGRLHTGLGQALQEKGFRVLGRELVDDFRILQFQQQIECVVNDLLTYFWHKDSYVIANSFGAYLFLHAQTQLFPYAGKVTLLSPIIGEFAITKSQLNFIPPRSSKLFEIARTGQFPILNQCQVFIGSQDWQSNPENVNTFCQLLNIKLTVVQNARHSLPKEYVSSLLN
jgi:hypothetical protein